MAVDALNWPGRSRTAASGALRQLEESSRLFGRLTSTPDFGFPSTANVPSTTRPGSWQPVNTRQMRTDKSFMRGLTPKLSRSEEHTSELQSLMRISYAVFCLKTKIERQQDANITTRHDHDYHANTEAPAQSDEEGRRRLATSRVHRSN